MTERMIRISNCQHCLHRSTRGPSWPFGGKPSSIPVCGKTGADLPYETVEFVKGSFCARDSGEIPDWCPLEKVQEN